MKTGKLLGHLLLAAALLTGAAHAARESRISATKHNLSSSGTGTTHSTTESQICVFCHTPHGADASQPAPLWNKTLQSTTYTPYTSSSLDASTIQGTSAGQPLGSSKLCLSCHDGVIALGSVRVLRGQANVTIGDGTQVTMPAGSGGTTGYTRLLGADLTNDHPISVTFDSTLSDRDGELRRPTMSTAPNGKTLNRWGTVFGARAQGDGYKPLLPLEPTGANGTGQVQCTTCHDPHIRETNLAAERNIKFLRANRFQKEQPTATYTAGNDILCLACHDKGMQGVGGNSWAYSVHANSQVATQTYKTAAADTREFPSTTSGAATNIQVWQAACLNCHDTHTVQGARRLLREGTDATPASALYLGGYKAGGGAALEETCYQCHTDTANSILNSSTSNPPNVKQDFQLSYRMRIRSVDQPVGGSETHDVGGNFNDTYNDCTGTGNKCGADLIESRSQLGNNNANNRHVECSDCHNPHRVAKFQLFYGNNGTLTGTPDGSAAHKHTDATGYTHTNVASGALRGSWGVEPSYTCCSFHSGATNYTIRRGDPGNDYIANTSTPDTKSYVTREYQVCLKCHSSFGYGTTPPNLDATNAKGLTPSGTNALAQYTDQAKEFQAPSAHQNGTGDNTTMNYGTEAGSADANFNGNNHRSWHPVMALTNRTLAKRGITSGTPFRLPWSNAVGTQTMYCSDCHGSATASTTAILTAGNTWGPHGSGNPFILKGAWSANTGKAANSGDLCFRCHEYNTYANGSGGSTDQNLCRSNKKTGFSNGNEGDLHCFHNAILTSKNSNNAKPLQCTWCHVAIPHGWKNKALLVNLNDVGQELGMAAGTSKEIAISGTSAYYTKGPYYLNAKLKVYSFAKSGQWSVSNCGSRNKQGTSATGLITSGDAAYGAGTGASASQSGDATSNGDKKWMVATCSPPAN